MIYIHLTFKNLHTIQARLNKLNNMKNCRHTPSLLKISIRVLSFMGSLVVMPNLVILTFFLESIYFTECRYVLIYILVLNVKNLGLKEFAFS